MSVAAWQARPGEVMPEWPDHLEEPPAWLKKLAKRVWDQEAELAHFISAPSQSGHAEGCEDFAAETVRSITLHLSTTQGYRKNSLDRIIERELITLQHHAERNHAQWQLLCTAYPQNVWEVPF